VRLPSSAIVPEPLPPPGIVVLPGGGIVAKFPCPFVMFSWRPLIGDKPGSLTGMLTGPEKIPAVKPVTEVIDEPKPITSADPVPFHVSVNVPAGAPPAPPMVTLRDALESWRTAACAGDAETARQRNV